MRKIEYDAEKIDRVAMVLVAIMAFVVVSFIICFPREYKLYGFDRQLLIHLVAVSLILLVGGGYAYWLFQRSNKITKYIKNMKRTGTRYLAWIVKVEEYDVYFRGRDYKSTYGVFVDCVIEGKNYKLLSKPLCFNPVEKLASGKCSVYVRDNTYVITDFDYKTSDSMGQLNVPVIPIDVDEPITVKHVEDFADFKLK